MTVAPRALFVVDSDSYVKWGGALAGQVPKDWTIRLVVARGNALPSDRQMAEALAGTPFSAADAEPVDRAGLAALLRSWRPDVVVAAMRGMAAEALIRLVATLPDRPVVVTGLAGISIPVLPPGLRLRRGADVFVVHSRREVREFVVAAREHGLSHRFELGTIPFLATAPRRVAADAMTRAGGDTPTRDRIVFAAQAMVPASRRDRAWLLRRLVDTARAHPHLTVVVKVRAREGEPQTHIEQFPYQQLLLELIESGERIPANLVIESGAMAWHLHRAVGMATISSTALLEAVSEDVPCIALDDFGVGARQINAVLTGSGLLGSTDDLVAGRFRGADRGWLDDNYLHDPDENTWIGAVEELVEQRRSGSLPPLPKVSSDPFQRLRRAVYERLSFGPSPSPLLHGGFLVVGFIEHRRRWAVMRLRRRLGRAGPPTTGTRP